jgi:hypothetical protein
MRSMRTKHAAIIARDPARDPKGDTVTVLLAATRDASWYARPNTRSLKAWHLLGEGGRSLCGLPALDVENSMPAEDVSEDGRCRRSGCVQWWPTRS